MTKTFYSFSFSLYLCALCFCILSFLGCINIAGECETEITRRIFNPDKSLQVITMVTDCGATTSPSYVFRIVEGSDITDKGVPDNSILSSNTGAGIKWVSNDTLLITGADTTNGYPLQTHHKLKKANINIIILYAD